MDSMSYRQQCFDSVVIQLTDFLKQTGFKESQLHSIPVRYLMGRFMFLEYLNLKYLNLNNLNLKYLNLEYLNLEYLIQRIPITFHTCQVLNGKIYVFVKIFIFSYGFLFYFDYFISNCCSFYLNGQ